MSRATVSILIAGMVLAAVETPAQSTAAPPIPSFTATTDHVGGAPDSIRINLMRWSTDAERDQLLAAWNLTGPPTGGRGAGRGARARSAGVADPALEDDDPALAGASPRAGGGGGAGRGAGRGGQGGGGIARGGAGSAAASRTPESSLAAALAQAPSVGYLWSSEVAGYALRYAVRLPQQEGERVILITDRRLGAWNELWKPVGPTADNATATSYEFSVIELRLNAKGEGEGKISLNGNVALDRVQGTIALENYNALPVILKNVRRQVPSQ
jgi:hypothetical protein